MQTALDAVGSIIPAVFYGTLAISALLIALAFFQRFRRATSTALFCMTAIFAVCIFCSAFITVFMLWGPIWAFLTLLTFGVPTLLAAAIALLTHGMWIDLLGMIMMIGAAIISFVVAASIRPSATSKSFVSEKRKRHRREKHICKTEALEGTR